MPCEHRQAYSFPVANCREWICRLVCDLKQSRQWKKTFHEQREILNAWTKTIISRAPRGSVTPRYVIFEKSTVNFPDGKERRMGNPPKTPQVFHVWSNEWLIFLLEEKHHKENISFSWLIHYFFNIFGPSICYVRLERERETPYASSLLHFSQDYLWFRLMFRWNIFCALFYIIL